MDNLLSRYRNATILAAVLFVQILGLAVQVKRPVDAARPAAGQNRLVRIWAVGLITPAEKGIAATGRFFGHLWRNYADLRGVRAENAELKRQIEEMRLQQVRLSEDAGQARRLQALLAFKEQYVNQTVAAQVIGTSGSEQARLLYIDKGSGAGIQRDMAVISPDGIVGKIKEVFPGTSQVLLINDVNSGAGAILENSRLQGTVKGTPAGGLFLDHIMADENVKVGERVLTSGGDQIFPKGFPIGTVSRVSPGSDVFLNVGVRPSANLNQLEEVLVITKMEERAPETTAGNQSMSAADILSQRLPTYQPPADAGKNPPAQKPGAPPPAPNPAAPRTAAPNAQPPAPVTTPPPGGTPR
jgi:rod shape-determining protein MreC